MYVSDDGSSDEHVFCRALQSQLSAENSLRHSFTFSTSSFAPPFPVADHVSQYSPQIVFTYQVRPPHLIHRFCIIQLDVEVLVDALQYSLDLDFVLEFDDDFVLHERLEETGYVSKHDITIMCCERIVVPED